MVVDVKMHDHVLDVLKRLQKRRPSFDKYVQALASRSRVIQSVKIDLLGQEARTRVIEWVRIGQALWGTLEVGQSYDLDRAQLLKLSLITAIIALMRYNYGVYKNARIVIEGRSSIGKTTYALTSLYGAFRLLGLEPDEAWRVVQGLTFMSPVDFAEFMLAVIDEDIFVPAVVLDEAGLAFSKYWLWMGKKYRTAFSSLLEIFDLIKDWIGVVILTSPTHENIAKRLRDICDYRISGDELSEYIGNKIHAVTVWAITKKTLRYIEAYSYPDKQLLKKAKLEDLIVDVDVMPSTVKLPRKIWQEHLQKRKEYVKQRLLTFRRQYLELESELAQETLTTQEETE